MFTFNPFDFKPRTSMRKPNPYNSSLIYDEERGFDDMYTINRPSVGTVLSHRSQDEVTSELKEQIRNKDLIITDLQNRLNTMEKVNRKLNDELSKFNNDVKSAVITCIEKLAKCNVVITQDADMSN